MKKGRITLPLAAIEANNGQLDWLPKNPRQWTKDDIQKTRASIEEDLDFLEDRPLLVVPHGEAFVVFAGNLRREGSVAAGCLNAPCVIYTPETPEDRETIKRRAIKDNGSFGSWDFDELANTWDDLPLADWGAPAWDFGTPKVNGNAGKSTGEVNLGDVQPEYRIVVTCESIDDQLKLIAELDDRGYNCKTL